VAGRSPKIGERAYARSPIFGYSLNFREVLNIYAVIRHPVYAGVLRLGMGLALLNGNAFSLFFGLLLSPLALTSWVRLVEERELIERFGSGYIEYRKETPAFWPRPRDLKKFFRFVLKG